MTKLKIIQNTEQKKVSTQYVVYHPDKYSKIYQWFLENIYFSLLNKNTRFLISTRQSRQFFLGFQQIVSPNIDLNLRIYQQNRYHNVPRSHLLRHINIFVILAVLTIFVASFMTKIMTCFPTPKDYFINPLNSCQLYKNILTFSLLRRLPLSAWREYQQELIQRESLIKKLLLETRKSDVYSTDWLHAHHISYHPLYTNYLNSLAQEAIVIDLFSQPTPVTSITYNFDIHPPKLYGSFTINFSSTPTSPLALKLPSGFLVTQVISPKGPLLSSQFIQTQNYLSLDISTYSNKPSDFVIDFESLLSPPVSSEYRFLIDLPINQTLSSHRLILNYPPKTPLTLKSEPVVARPGSIEYNLALQGLTLIKLVYGQTPP